MADRQKEFKNKGKDAEAARRQRANEKLTLRKNVRAENNMKKRNVGVTSRSSLVPGHGVEELARFVEYVFANEVDHWLVGTQGIRKILSREQNPPIDEVIATGVIPRLCMFLSVGESTRLQLEAAWSLTNIASGSPNQTRAVVDHGTVPLFIELVKSSFPDLVDQATWALGNIAGDGPECRDLVIQMGAVPVIIKAIAPKTCDPSVIKNAMWAISNICRGKNPPPDFNQVKGFLPVIGAWLRITDDAEIISDALWTLSYLSDGPSEQIEALIESGIALKLVELLMHPQHSVVIPDLRVIGNITTGSNTETQVVINVGCVPQLLHLLSSSETKIRKEACWAISNITAGTIPQIEVILSLGLIEPLVFIAEHDEYRVRAEAMWAITNACCGGSPSQIRLMVESGCLGQMCMFLADAGAVASVLAVVLDAIIAVLQSAENERVQLMYCSIIEECDGIEKIDMLQQHSSEKVYEKANKIITDWFSQSEDGVLDLMEPEEGENGAMAFNAPGNNTSNFNF
eukprot:CFRG7932T1